MTPFLSAQTSNKRPCPATRAWTPDCRRQCHRLTWFADNTGKWSGDHCIAADLVPGILVTNRKVRNPDPKLYDLTVSILSEFGIEKPEDMIGTPIF